MNRGPIFALMLGIIGAILTAAGAICWALLEVSHSVVSGWGYAILMIVGILFIIIGIILFFVGNNKSQL